jgi:quercetin dioxygenase-like cupin family protein
MRLTQMCVRATREEIMRRYFSLPLASGFVIVGLGLISGAPIAAQYAQPSLTTRFGSGWENDRLRVRTVSIAPGGQTQTAADVDRVVVFLGADLDGRMPSAEAVWQAAGPASLQNRGQGRADAVVVELKAGQARATAPPQEALLRSGEIDTRVLIDNPRVTVIKHRYWPYSYAIGPWHFHSEDAVVVYLRGGYTWASATGPEPYRVRRGEIDIVPRNTFHTFANAGGDPLEFLTIFPK